MAIINGDFLVKPRSAAPSKPAAATGAVKVEAVLQTSTVLVCCVVALHVGRMCIHGDIKAMQFFGFHSRSHVNPLAEIVHDPPFAQLAGSSGNGTGKGPSNSSAAASLATGAPVSRVYPALTAQTLRWAQSRTALVTSACLCLSS